MILKKMLENIKRNPLIIASTGVFSYILFQLLPMNPGYELALAYIPLAFVVVAIVLAIIYWILTLKIKNQQTLKYLFIIFFTGSLFLGIITSLEVAFG